MGPLVPPIYRNGKWLEAVWALADDRNRHRVTVTDLEALGFHRPPEDPESEALRLRPDQEPK